MVPLNKAAYGSIITQAGSAMLKEMRSLLPYVTLEQLESGTFAYGK
jgi:hypothetical protein